MSDSTLHSTMRPQDAVPVPAVLALLPPPLRDALTALPRDPATGPIYLVGGALRDLLLGRAAHDVDLCVPRNAAALAQRLADRTGGAFVLLDKDEDVARVVLPDGMEADVAAFRAGAATIEADLALRDFTIDALALNLEPVLRAEDAGHAPPALPLIDPCAGVADLAARRIRMTHAGAFVADPLRMARAYRLAAALDCRLDAETRSAVRGKAPLITRAAGERVSAELNALLRAPRAFAAIQAMREDGLLFHVIPELALGEGVAQPKVFHHLNVLDHNLETLRQAELLVGDPRLGFPEADPRLLDWAADEDNRLILKWAALLHDAGKPEVRVETAERVSFHQHEQAGLRLVGELAGRLRWSGRQQERVCGLIMLHMRPHHLVNLLRAGELGLKACIRLIKAAAGDLPGLMLLAQADTMAGRGPERPADQEERVADLAALLETVRRERVEPAGAAPPLLTGDDLIRELGLTPGPLFKTILAAVDMARMTGDVADREEALNLARQLAREHQLVNAPRSRPGSPSAPPQSP